MRVIKNPAVVDDKDLARAYEIVSKFLEEKGYEIKEVQMAVSPFAPTYQKSMIVEVSPLIKDVIERVELERSLQKKVGRKVGVSLV
jgi:ribosomal protein RSM22 (predicted rRNA methylase)